MERIAILIAVALSSLLTLILTASSAESNATKLLGRITPASDVGLCAQMIHPLGYPCTEHTVETEDGFLLTIQRISHKSGSYGPPVFLQHGLFQGGDTWFVNSPEDSLGFIFADHGFDVFGLGMYEAPVGVKMLLTMGIHQLNFRSAIGVEILNYLCDGHMDCSNMLAAITVIRKGTFAKYDYGLWGNLKRYGNFKPPSFDLRDIPESLPLWLAYGGSDALADVTDVKMTIKELKSEPELLYLDPYGHIDFITSVKAKDDVYGSLVRFLQSAGGSSSY